MLANAADISLPSGPMPPLRAPSTGDEMPVHGGIRRLGEKEHAFCEGDLRESVFQIKTGVVAIYKTLSDGRRQIIDFAYPGDLIGLGLLPEHSLSAQAMRPTTLQCLSSATLERMAANDAALALKLYRTVCQELAATRSLLVSVGQKSALERVAQFLLDLSRRPRATLDAPVRLPMRRSDIGDLLGLTIETVSRTLTKLRAMGVIELASGGSDFRVCDAERLARLANE